MPSYCSVKNAFYGTSQTPNNEAFECTVTTWNSLSMKNSRVTSCPQFCFYKEYKAQIWSRCLKNEDVKKYSEEMLSQSHKCLKCFIIKFKLDDVQYTESHSNGCSKKIWY